MAILASAYPKFEAPQGVVTIWYDFFEDVRADVFAKAVKSHVRNSPFAPKINELLERCEEAKVQVQDDTLLAMWEAGYFDGSHRNYEKAQYWVSRGTSPEWFMADMRKFYKNHLVIGNLRQPKLLK